MSAGLVSEFGLGSLLMELWPHTELHEDNISDGILSRNAVTISTITSPLMISTNISRATTFSEGVLVTVKWDPSRPANIMLE